MGYALAEEAARRGHSVVLVSGPVTLGPPRKVRLIRIETAVEMLKVVLKEAFKADLVLMAAAVSDFRPALSLSKKFKKTGKGLTARFVPNPDILKTLGGRKKPGQLLVGFAAETDHLRRNALKKLRKKNLDLIVANTVGGPQGGFESDRNSAVLLSSSGIERKLAPMTKTRMAGKILDFVCETLLEVQSKSLTVGKVPGR